MIDKSGMPQKTDIGFAVRLLVSETGITVAQATELIALLGLNWSSLLREARIMNSKP